MKLVIASSGASGAIYLQRLLHHIQPPGHEVHLVLSNYAKQVIREEIDELIVPPGIIQHSDQGMNVPFVSGSARFDAMVIVPCSMGALGRIASGVSDDLITRAADVCLKERRPLILVPRETPLNLIHLRNMVQVTEAGATVLPAMPSFYNRSTTIDELVDTVVARILQALNVPQDLVPQWQAD